jgi:hypothetical protein
MTYRYITLLPFDLRGCIEECGGKLNQDMCFTGRLLNRAFPDAINAFRITAVK